ncbi:MAG: DUF952 domain-containing protein [Hyphomicrobiales bacterium]
MQTRTIYKICTEEEWAEARRTGTYRGSQADLRDGFIHFSTGPQAAGTARQHFAGQADLVLVSFLADDLGPGLKWEPSRGGALFPHFYGELPAAAARSVVPLPLSEEGHVFPELDG